MTTKKLIVAAFIATGLAVGMPMKAAEEKEHAVHLKDVPEAVQKAIKEHAAGGEIIRVEKETEKGKPVYEAVIKKEGKEMGIGFDADGKVLEKEHGEKAEHLKKE